MRCTNARKIAIMKMFCKIHQLWWNPLLIKRQFTYLQFYFKRTQPQVFSRELYEIFQSSNLMNN